MTERIERQWGHDSTAGSANATAPCRGILDTSAAALLVLRYNYN